MFTVKIAIFNLCIKLVPLRPAGDPKGEEKVFCEECYLKEVY